MDSIVHGVAKSWDMTERLSLFTFSLMVGLRSSSKALPKTKLSLNYSQSQCLVVCCPSDPLQLSEFWWDHYIWEVCSANQWDTPKTAMPAASSDQQKGPNSLPQPLTAHCTTKASKVERVGLRSSASSAIFIWSLINRLSLLPVSWQLFAGKMLPQSEGGRKCSPRVCWILKHGFLCYRNKLLLIGKNILIVMAPILINKGVFEPSYNDSKFTAQNCNFVCTNLTVTRVWGVGA